MMTAVSSYKVLCFCLVRVLFGKWNQKTAGKLLTIRTSAFWRRPSRNTSVNIQNQAGRNWKQVLRWENGPVPNNPYNIILIRVNCKCLCGSGGLYKDAHVNEAPLFLCYPEKLSGWDSCWAKAITTPKESSSPASLAAGDSHMGAGFTKNAFHLLPNQPT